MPIAFGFFDFILSWYVLGPGLALILILNAFLGVFDTDEKKADEKKKPETDKKDDKMT